MITVTIVCRVVQLGAATLLVGTYAWQLLVLRPTLPRAETMGLSAEGTAFAQGLHRLRVGSLLGLVGCGMLGLWVYLVTITNQALFHALSREQLANGLLRTQYGRVELLRLGLIGLLGGACGTGRGHAVPASPGGCG